jgi:hypothetical protein
MPKKLSRIEREMRDHPEKFDYPDFPPLRKLTPAQQARYDAMRPQWAKDLIGGSTGSAEDTDLAASNGDVAQLVFPSFQ